MARPISLDLRERVCEAVSEGLSRHQAAARFKVSASSAIRWQAWLQASGSVAPANVGGDRWSDRIEAAEAHLLYLPPYSSDFNPIEMAFSKFKALMRATEPRTVEDLWRAGANAIEKISPKDCSAYFNEANYAA